MCETKVCTKCREEKSISEFYKRSPNTFLPRCKKCLYSYQRQYVSEHKKETLETQRKWIEKNREAVNAKRREYHHKNPEKARKYAKNNKEKVRKAARNYYYRNKEKCRARHLAWLKNNSEKVRQYQKEAGQARRQLSEYKVQNLSRHRRIREELRHSYVKHIAIYSLGFPKETLETHPEILETVKQRIQLKRVSKTINKKIKEHDKD